MKKAFSVLFAILLVALLSLSAFADMIWEPYNDSFYAEHYEECKYSGRYYTAQAEADVYESPLSDRVVGTIDEGASVYITYIWPSDATWAYVEILGAEGWVDMANFVKEYNASDFYADHEDEIIEADGAIPFDVNPVIVLWEYPGSERREGVIYASYYEPEDCPTYFCAYVDENGVLWGEIGYFYGMSGWVNLADPGAGEPSAVTSSNGETPVINDEPGEPTPAPETPEETETPGESQNTRAAQPIGLAATIVVIVIAVSVILLCLLSYKKK